MEDVLQKFIDELGSPEHKCDAPPSNEDDLLKKDHDAYQVLKNKDYDGDISLKRIYAISIIVVLGLWEIFVIVYMLLQICPERRLSDTVLIALLTSATANILVLPTIVLKYLFPNRGN